MGDDIVEIPQALSGERLDRAVALLTNRTRSEVTRIIQAGGVAIGGAVVLDRSRRLSAGDLLHIAPQLVAEVQVKPSLEPADVAFGLVYEDEDVIVVDKPLGVVTHPGAGTTEPTLVAGVLARFPEIAGLPAAGYGSGERPGIVHRLDKDTSGLLVVARSIRGFESLTEQLADRSAKRTYAALVLGTVSAAEGMVDAPIGRSRRDPTKMTVTPDGKQARTSYLVQHRYSQPIEATELELKLETGRTHQIRVHLSAIGHAVVGDTRYGGARRLSGVTRLMLHARRLGFNSPSDGLPMEFESEPPADFRESLSLYS